MVNFEPKWDLVVNRPLVQEGVISTAIVKMSKNRPADISTIYNVKDDQFLEIGFSVSYSGETFDPRDIIINVGEGTTIPLESIDAMNPSKFGSFKTKILRTNFDITGRPAIDFYKFEITYTQDGVWDSNEEVTVSIDYIKLMTTIDGQISNEEDVGIMGASSISVVYDKREDVWVTPDLTVRGELYTIGEISYGADSTLFVDAYGKSEPYSGSSGDTSNRVYVPMYKMSTLDISELPPTNITSAATIFSPDPSDAADKKEFQSILIKDQVGTDVKSGLSFLSNGQILLTMLYQSEPIDSYFKAEIVPMDYYEPIGQQYYEGKKFRAYQTWVSPSTDSELDQFADPKPLKNHVYLLNDTSVYPYTVETELKNGSEVLTFDPTIWKDMGYYDPSLGDGIVGKTKIFRVVVNDSSGSGIEIITPSNLGNIHVGEYYGHTVYAKIEAKGSDLISYTINPSSRDDIRKYNIDLSPDGTIVGTVYAQSSDFSVNDDIKLEFTIDATAKNGKTASGTFNIRIIRGLSQNTLSAHLVPSLNFERAWFESVSSSTFNTFKYYRESDPRYGLQKVPRILLKENLVSTTFNWQSLADTKELLRDGIVNTVSGAPVPESTFKLVLGNYKVRSALDKSGNVLYDVLYREILSGDTLVQLSKDSTKYTDVPPQAEFYGLRQNIVNIVFEDIRNLITDPDDLRNRGLIVPAVDGISNEMIDTVPRFMNHPYEGTGAQPGILVCAVVAFLKPGTGEAAFNELMKNSEHGKMLGMSFDVPFVQFRTFNTDNPEYVPVDFMIPVKSRNLML